MSHICILMLSVTLRQFHDYEVTLKVHCDVHVNTMWSDHTNRNNNNITILLAIATEL